MYNCILCTKCDHLLGCFVFYAYLWFQKYKYFMVYLPGEYKTDYLPTVNRYTPAPNIARFSTNSELYANSELTEPNVDPDT